MLPNSLNERHKTIYKLLKVSNSLEYDIQHMLKPYKFTIAQYSLLRALRGHYPLPANVMALRHEMIDKMSDVTRLINRLAERNLIIKKISPDDKRVCEVFISEKGLKELIQVEKDLEDVNFLKELDSEKFNLLNGILDEILLKQKEA
jgi:DNA-binding MarR family transcriptional regulator